MVTVAIVGILLSIAIPTYERHVLKGRFEEAKVTIQAIILAQERVRTETGNFYPLSGEIRNENLIRDNLNVDLSESNNFIYELTANTSSDSVLIRAILRKSTWNTDCNSNELKRCKQDDSKDEDPWVSKYNTGVNRHYISIDYPEDNEIDEYNMTKGGLI